MYTCDYRMIKKYILALVALLSLSQVAYAQGRAYVANFASNSVSVIDTSSNTVSHHDQRGDNPTGWPSHRTEPAPMWRTAAADVWVVATSNNTVVATVRVGATPAGWPSPRTEPALTSRIATHLGLGDPDVKQHRGCHDKCCQQSLWGGHHTGRNSCLRDELRLLGHHRWRSVAVIDTSSNTVVATAVVGLARRGWPSRRTERVPM